MKIRRLSELSVQGKRVLCRVDFNVSRDQQTGAISDETRIRAALPTIRDLLGRGARLVLCSHFGRPKGRRVPEWSLKPVAENLAGQLGQAVALAGDCVGEDVRPAVEALRDGEVLLLENLRFHPGEERDDAAFAGQLAEWGEVYVNDAFGAAHRAHASVHALPKLFSEKAAGLLMERELAQLGQVLQAPERPFVVILGGAKISGKLQVIRNLLPRCDAMLIGGGMAYTFLKAQGRPTGRSLVEEALVATAKELLAEAKASGKTFLLPLDHVVAGACEAGAPSQVVDGDKIPDGKMALDIGPRTVARYAREIAKARTVLWNGPQGVFELEPFHKGTFAIARAVAGSGAVSVVGGGESVAALKQAGVADRITHISTGGGASLEFLGGKELPGVAALAC